MKNIWKYVLIILVMVMGAFNIQELEWFLGISALSGLLFLGPGRLIDFLLGGFIGSLLILVLDSPPEVVRTTLAGIVGIDPWLLMFAIVAVTTLSFALPAWAANQFAFDRVKY